MQVHESLQCSSGWGIAIFQFDYRCLKGQGDLGTGENGAIFKFSEGHYGPPEGGGSPWAPSTNLSAP